MCTKAWFGHGLEDASDVSDADALTIEGALYFQHFASSKALTSRKTRASSEILRSRALNGLARPGLM